MKEKYKKEFNKIADKLLEINRRATKDRDKEAKEFSGYLMEVDVNDYLYKKKRKTEKGYIG